MGLKSTEDVCRVWAGHLQVSHLVALADSCPAVILFGSLTAGRWREVKVMAKAAFTT